MAKRRKYSEEFKREAVGLTGQPGASVSQVARDIGVGSNLLFRWRRKLEAEDKPFPGSGVARGQELLALKRELAKVKREQDFLRDTAAFFASESKWSVRRFSAVAVCTLSS
jgi:transposase